MELEMLIGRNIRDARDEAGMTQEALGAALEPYIGRRWSRQAVSIAEGGGRDFRAVELLGLARVLGKPVGWFFGPLDLESDAVETPGGGVLSAYALIGLIRSGGDARPEHVIRHVLERVAPKTLHTFRMLKEGVLALEQDIAFLTEVYGTLHGSSEPERDDENAGHEGTRAADPRGPGGEYS